MNMIMSLMEFRKLYHDMHSLLLWITSEYNIYHEIKDDMQKAWDAFPTTTTSSKSLHHTSNIYDDIIQKATIIADTAAKLTEQDIRTHLDSLLSYGIDYHLQRCKRICQESDTLKTDTGTISRLDKISEELTHFRNEIKAFILNKNQYFVDRNSGRKRK